MPPWTPDMAWPSSTVGGVVSPDWGGYTKLFVRAAIGSGNSFHMGDHDFDRLDAGNVMGGGEPGPGGTLWVDLACDVLTLEIAAGASTSQGIFSKPDAATLTAVIADPDGIYDPLHPGPGFMFGGFSRLTPGTPIEVFAEVVDATDGSVSTHYLFTGTADSWAQDWTPHAWDRQTTLVATDYTKNFVRMDRPEVAPVGAGDTTEDRIDRIVTYFGWDGTVISPGTGIATLQATTLAQSAWELVNRTLDDELGYVHFTPEGALRWLDRTVWTTVPDPAVHLGCDLDPGHDILIDASPSALDRQMRNAVFAARTGGTTQTAVAQSSIDRYGQYDYTRTDLGLNDDTQAGAWATFVLQLYAYPQVTLDDVTMRPDIAEEPWTAWDEILGLDPVSDIVHIHWEAPDLEDHVVDAESRMVGYKHTISRVAWSVRWQLVAANPIATAGAIFTMGPDPQDRLDRNFVMGLAA